MDPIDDEMKVHRSTWPRFYDSAGGSNERGLQYLPVPNVVSSRRKAACGMHYLSSRVCDNITAIRDNMYGKEETSTRGEDEETEKYSQLVTGRTMKERVG